MTEPLRGFTSPEMVLTSVVFPAPLAPSTAVMVPSATDSDTWSSATTPPYATVRLRISSMGNLLAEICGRDVVVGADVVRANRYARTRPRLSTVMLSLTASTMSTLCSTSAIAMRSRSERSSSTSCADVGRGQPARRLVEQQQRRGAP